MNRIIYHSKDFDGLASAAFVVHGTGGEYTLYPYNYGEPLPDFSIWSKSKDTVYMVDVSYPKEYMLLLAESFPFYWIDHHKSAIEDNRALNIAGRREVGTAACALVWKELIGELGEPLPPGLNLLSKYDVWDQSDPEAWENSILPFQYGLKLIAPWNIVSPAGLAFWNPQNPEGIFHDLYYISKVIEQGKTALAALRNHFAYEVEHYGYAREFHGFRALCINAPNINSMRLEGRFDKEKYDLMLVWCMVGTNTYPVCQVSLYSTKPEVDCAAIAQIYGGGGASGGCWDED